MNRKRLFLYVFLVLAILLHFTAMAASFQVGDKSQVLWKGKWYPATVEQVKDGKYFIHYDGWSNSWDEWVGADRIKPASATTTAFAKGEAVEVQWKGAWYKASVKQVKNGKYYIHYDGYSNSWDEWVGPKRIRKK